jgi:Na+-transporting methylmalonyl-CoA/oxaloacetate decarboxylase beta subunit
MNKNKNQMFKKLSAMVKTNVIQAPHSTYDKMYNKKTLAIILVVGVSAGLLITATGIIPNEAFACGCRHHHRPAVGAAASTAVGGGGAAASTAVGGGGAAASTAVGGGGAAASTAVG